MKIISVDFALIVVIVVTVFLMVFCNQMGHFANAITPGTGYWMSSLGAASGFLAIITAANLTILFATRMNVKKKVESPFKKPRKKARKKK